MSMNNKSLSRIIPFILLISLVLSLFSCGNKYDFPKSTEEELETVLKIDDYEVPFELYRYFIMNYMDTYLKSSPDIGFEKLDEMAKNSIVRIYATFALAADHDIDYKSGKVQKEVVEKLNASVEEDFGGLDKFLSTLGPAHLNTSVYKLILTEFECESLLYDALTEEGIIKTDDDTAMKAISGGEFCCAKQVLILNDPGDDPAENKKLAEDILMKAQLGIDFDTLVAEHGEDMDMVTNPSGYVFTHGELIEEFEDAAFELEIGEMSGVVESPIGYHIVLRCEIDPGYVAEHFDELAESYRTSRYYIEVTKKAETMTVTETDFWRTLSLDSFK